MKELPAPKGTEIRGPNLFSLLLDPETQLHLGISSLSLHLLDPKSVAIFEIGPLRQKLSQHLLSRELFCREIGGLLTGEILPLVKLGVNLCTYISSHAIQSSTPQSLAPPSSVLQQPPCQHHLNLSQLSIISAIFSSPPGHMLSYPPRHHQHFNRPSVIHHAAANSPVFISPSITGTAAVPPYSQV